MLTIVIAYTITISPLNTLNVKYFCNTLGDVINASSIDCKMHNTDGVLGHNTRGVYVFQKDIDASWTTTFEHAKGSIDRRCKEVAPQIKFELLLFDKTSIYQANPAYTFGFVNEHNRVLAHTIETPESTVLYREPNDPLEGGLLTYYKILCVDIDGVPENATIDECVNECPFGYGIRVDGRILNGERADEWLVKKIQEN